MTVNTYEPYRLCFQVVAIVLGAAYLATVPPPGSVAEVVGKHAHWLVYLWAAGLMVSGMGALVGSLWAAIQTGRADPIVGYALERGSLTVQDGALFILIGATIYTSGLRGLFGVGILAAWMAANIWRDQQIASYLRKARDASQE